MPRSRRNWPMAACSSRWPLMKWHEASATSRVFSSTCPITSTARMAPRPRVLSRRTCTPLWRPGPSTDTHWTDNRRDKSGCCRPAGTRGRRRRSSGPARWGPRGKLRRAGSSAIARRPARASAMRCRTNASWSPSVPPLAQSAMAWATRRGSAHTPAWARKILFLVTGNSCWRSSSFDRISARVMTFLEAIRDVAEITGVEADNGAGHIVHDQGVDDAREGF